VVYYTQNNWVSGHCPSSEMFSSYLEFRTLDKVLEPSDSDQNVCRGLLFHTTCNRGDSFSKSSFLELVLYLVNVMDAGVGVPLTEGM
jgi:hypothetical protein